jgi:vacuolar-type H+-ATPase subunit H
MKQTSVYTRRRVSDLRAEAQRLIETGQMPTLAQVLEAVAEARQEYADQIRAARKESERLSK